jgi:hypothetical protein
MAVVSIKNKLRRGNLLVGNDPYIPTDFESIATVTVGSGGSSEINFTSIPATYSHLQIRGIVRDSSSLTGAVATIMRFNSDSGSNYGRHDLRGDGSTVSAGANTPATLLDIYAHQGGGEGINLFSPFVIDILDYANTNKYKTVRCLAGWDQNGAGRIYFTSGLWQSSTAINAIKMYSGDSTNWAQYSHFALYGIKGA